MFKLKNTHQTTYGEIHQPNPLRWRIMFREKNVLSSQSGIIKCKDFFNDVVAWKKAKMAFSMYSFKNDIKFNRYGVYFHITGIEDRDRFFANLDVLNQRLQQDLNTKVSYYKASRCKTAAIIHIPNPLWENTYRISLVTMMIRLSNYAMAYEGWDDFFKEDAPMCTADKAFTKEAQKLTKAFGFNPPAITNGCWYYSTHGYISKKCPKPAVSIIHNNGCSSWAKALEGAI